MADANFTATTNETNLEPAFGDAISELAESQNLADVARDMASKLGLVADDGGKFYPQLEAVCALLEKSISLNASASESLQEIQTACLKNGSMAKPSAAVGSGVEEPTVDAINLAPMRAAHLSSLLNVITLAEDCEHSVMGEKTRSDVMWLACSLADEIVELVDVVIKNARKSAAAEVQS